MILNLKKCWFFFKKSWGNILHRWLIRFIFQPRCSRKPYHTKYRDRPRIGFYCSIPYLYSFFSNIHREIPEVEILAIDNTPLKKYQSILNHHLDQYKITYTTSLEGQVDYFLIYTSFKWETILRHSHPHTKKILMMYSPNGRLTTFDPHYVKDFDLLLSCGEYFTQGWLPHIPTKTVGLAKFDSFLSGISKNEAAASMNLNPHKPTLFYAPTTQKWHASHSRIPPFWSHLISLASRYQILVKPHPSFFLSPEEASKYAFFKNTPIHLVTDPICSLEQCLKVSDIVISDASGAVYEAAAADKPIILIENEMNAAEVLSKKQGVIYHYRDLGIRVNTLDQLVPAIERSLAMPEAFKEKRREYADLFLSYRDQTASKRTAEAIHQYIEDTFPAMLKNKFKH